MHAKSLELRSPGAPAVNIVGRASLCCWLVVDALLQHCWTRETWKRLEGGEVSCRKVEASFRPQEPVRWCSGIASEFRAVMLTASCGSIPSGYTDCNTPIKAQDQQPGSKPKRRLRQRRFCLGSPRAAYFKVVCKL